MVLLGASWWALLVACHHPVAHPSFSAAADAPAWPQAEAPARVVFLSQTDLGRAEQIVPLGIACDAAHHLAVTDAVAGKVYVASLDAGTLRVASSWRGFPLAEPVGVALLGEGRLAVVDAANAALLVSEKTSRIELEPALLPVDLVRPTGIARLHDDSLAVVDTGQRAVMVWDERDSDERTEVQATIHGDLRLPVGVAQAPDGGLYVVDALSASIERIDGERVTTIVGDASGRPSDLVRPKSIAFDTHGNLHVVDGAMQHVEIYDPQGTLLGRYGGPGSGPGELSLPAGICIDAHDHIFVADSGNGRVQIYGIEGGR